MKVNRLLSPTELPMIAYRHYFTTIIQSFVRLSCPHEVATSEQEKGAELFFAAG